MQNDFTLLMSFLGMSGDLFRKHIFPVITLPMEPRYIQPADASQCVLRLVPEDPSGKVLGQADTHDSNGHSGGIIHTICSVFLKHPTRVSWHLQIYMFYAALPVVPHKAVAEVSE